MRYMKALSIKGITKIIYVMQSCFRAGSRASGPDLGSALVLQPAGWPILQAFSIRLRPGRPVSGPEALFRNIGCFIWPRIFRSISGPSEATAGLGSSGNGSGSTNSADCVQNAPLRPTRRPVFEGCATMRSRRAGPARSGLDM